MLNIEKIQAELALENSDGWLFYNFRDLDQSATHILAMPLDRMLTRRWFYLIPQRGEPVKLVHRIEPNALEHLPGSKRMYSGWKQLHRELWNILSPLKRICMQYSPMNAIPYVSYVDAGTLELVRSTGVEVHSSANLIQSFEAVWPPEGIQSHENAAQALRRIVHEAFAHAGSAVKEQRTLTEYQLQQFILDKFKQEGLICNHPPIVAVNEHSGNPHYEPLPESSSLIKENDFLLIDLWAKYTFPNAIYADITWVGELAKTVHPKHVEIFTIVRNARDAALRLIQEHFAANKPIAGYQVDNQAREVIEQAGYGQYFVHRTGHSIGQEDHWKGVNMDNFETRDERRLIEGIGFSIEPGIYLPDFGVRSEINVYIHNHTPYVSALPSQNEVIPILA